MIRSMDASHLNEVANDPAVRILLGGEGELDLTELMSDARNVALQNEHGGFLFLKQDDRRYELHTMFRPDGRGKTVAQAAAFAFRYMFVSTDCTEIVTRCPEPNRAADFMARHCGFRPIFERPGAWIDGSAIRYFWLPFEDWRGHAPALATEGHAFHELLEAAKRAKGSGPVHPDDEAHDRAAGAAVLMVKAGQPRKAVALYNRWAALAGYAQIALLSEAPIIIDVLDAVVGLQDGQLEVLLCR